MAEAMSADAQELPGDVLERAEDLWRRTVEDRWPQVRAKAFSDWGSADNERVWASAPTMVARRASLIVAPETTGVEPDADLVELMSRCMELGGLHRELELAAQGRLDAAPVTGGEEPATATSAADVGEHARAVGERTLSHRRAGAGPLAQEYHGRAKAAGAPLTLSASVRSVGPVTGAAAGMSTARSRALPEQVGKTVRVEADAALVALLQSQFESLLAEAGIPVTTVGSNSSPVSRPGAANAALALVLRAAGVPDVVLSEDGELLCELLAASGDLARTTHIDGQLAEIGERLVELDRRSRATQRTVNQVQREQFSTGLIGALSLAERLRVIKVPLNPRIDQISAIDPLVLDLLDHLSGQAASEERRRRDARGRPSARRSPQSGDDDDDD